MYVSQFRGYLGDEFETSVSISCDKAIVDAWANSENDPESGAAYIFENANISVGFSDIDATSASTVSIFPNPTNGNISLKVGVRKILSVSIYSMDGRAIYKKKNIKKSVYFIDINKAVAGVYVVEIECSGEKKHLKLVKQ